MDLSFQWLILEKCSRVSCREIIRTKRKKLTSCGTTQGVFFYWRIIAEMSINPADSLLLKYVHTPNNFRILVLEGGDGWLAETVSSQIPLGEIISVSRDVRDVGAAKKRLESIPNASAIFDILPKDNDFDLVLLAIPKGRWYTRKLLISAWSVLKPGGKLFIAGPTKKGAKAVIKDAECIFGKPILTGYQNHNRVAGFLRGDFLPDPMPEEFSQVGIAPGTTHLIELVTSEGRLVFETQPGIFSWDAIDEGTSLLLDNLEVLKGQKVWDVGCGYGVIGIYSALQGASKVLMTDINMLAILYTEKNIHRNNLKNLVYAEPGDCFSPSTFENHPPPYDLIVSNPAFHQEHKVNTSMADNIIKTAPEILSSNGKLILVANRFLNYDRSMKQYFKVVKTIAETNKYHVLSAQN